MIKQIDRAAKLVMRIGKHARIDMAVRADKRQIFDRFVERQGGAVLSRL